MSGGLELLGHQWVDGNHHLTLVLHDHVPLLDLLSHPVAEVLANDCSTNVHDPLLRRLRQVTQVRKVAINSRLPVDEVHDVLHS